VLSGNRNFEGRVNPHVKANYLASPPLVVAYAIAGTMLKDVTREPLGQDKDGNDVYLKDIWPTQAEIAHLVEQTVTRESFQEKYADVFAGDEAWQGVETSGGLTYSWPSASTYVQNPPYFRGYGQGSRHHRQCRQGPHSGGSGRLHHHRPHLAGRFVHL
jgi:aconitate hydratase